MAQQAILKLLITLYRRFEASHIRARFPVGQHEGADGDRTQVIERRSHGGCLEVTGWSDSSVVRLATTQATYLQLANGTHLNARARRLLGKNAKRGFKFVVPFAQKPQTLLIGADDGGPSIALAALPSGRLWQHRLALIAYFALRLALVTPLLAAWLLTRSKSVGHQINKRLGLFAADWVQYSRSSERVLLALPRGRQDSVARANDLAAEQTKRAEITVILPVYNAFDLLPDVLERLAQNTDLPWRAIIVEDASPDERVRPFVRDWAMTQNGEQADRVVLLENDANRGFIGSVNRAFAAFLDGATADAGPVILLNSDAFVPKGWASRLVYPLFRDPIVASVTPMANDAEIFNVPVMCVRDDFQPGEADRLDQFAADFDPDHAMADAPTGVGFCMAINADWLRRIGDFDTIFGKGYGEEVDWCQRARAAGGRHVGIGNLVVEHRGGSSFGSETKRRQIETNNGIVSGRYRDYDADVQAFVRADPLVSPRMALSMYYSDGRASDGLTVFIAHSLGGGAEDWLKAEIATRIERDGAAVVIRVGGSWRFALELWTEIGVTEGFCEDIALLEYYLAPITKRRVVYSCGVGDPAADEIPEHLMRLSGGSADHLTILFHDYFPLSPVYTLTLADDAFHGLEALESDPDHASFKRADGSAVSMADWQRGWSPAIEAADELVVFSNASAKLVAAVYPQVVNRLTVKPHHLLSDIASVSGRSRSMNERINIGVLGGLAPAKGAPLVEVLSKLIGAGDDFALTIVGSVDPRFSLHRQTTVHGRYAREEISDLAARYQLDCWLIPSLWPETFSFTTHEAIATGLPVICFDVGAQADAVRAYGKGGVVPLTADLAALSEQVLDAVRSSVR